MGTFEELVRMVKSYNEGADMALLEKAYQFASKAHKNQLRASGEPYIAHPLEVARILAGMKLDLVTIAAGLLHDVIEDTGVEKEELEKEFGPEIPSLVDGVTKLTHMGRGPHTDLDGVASACVRRDVELSSPSASPPQEERRAENLRKIFMAMAKDVRVILIKLADRLHNLRTLSPLPSFKQRAIARETLEIYAPLTHRLGMWQLKWEMEDLSFSYLEPEQYRSLVAMVAKKRAEREEEIGLVIDTLKKRLEQSGIQATIEGRPKHLYSIWQKMSKKGKGFTDIYDLTAVRILVPSIEDCYAALGLVHSLWMPIHDRIKDYIAKPKSNNYRSLHTTVYGPGHHPVEIQIRTLEMHKIAEYGVAAHWQYKEGAERKRSAGGRTTLRKSMIPWMKQLIDWQVDLASSRPEEPGGAREFVKAFKGDFLESQVFVFTPNGDVIDLPAGSTPIDFAYRIHTDVGHRCVGAKVNGKIVPLEYQLNNGDIVEILTSKSSQGPSWDWLQICKTSAAKHKLRLWFKKERREENIQRGKEALIRELKRQRINPEEVLKDDLIEKLAQRLNVPKGEDLLAAVGYGEIHVSSVTNKLKEEIGLPGEPSAAQPQILKSPARRKPAHGVRVRGVDNILVRFSKCCSPLPGDPIVGYVTIGKGVSIHRQECSSLRLLSSHKERMVQAAWDLEGVTAYYPAEIEVECWDKAGLLGEIMMAVSESGINTKTCKAWAKKDRATIRLVLEVMNVGQLQTIMKKIKQIKEVIEVIRLAPERSQGHVAV